jgi:hypothetical protein
MLAPPLDAHRHGMETNSVMYRQAEMAYRTSYLTEQLQRPGARAHHGRSANHRRRIHLPWRSHSDSTAT